MVIHVKPDPTLKVISLQILPMSLRKGKKGSKNSKENYRPSTILPNVSKFYKRCLYSQMPSYFEKVFSKY